jgi:hypothetical protein
MSVLQSAGSCPRNSEPDVSQCPAADQRRPLSTHRVVSSIPKTDAFTPAHQVPASENWTYPSEQMFYNALRRKGFAADESVIPAVIAIHNTVNEQAWSRVLEWESIHYECVAAEWCELVGAGVGRGRLLWGALCVSNAAWRV